jgi:hypothetical protein
VIVAAVTIAKRRSTAIAETPADDEDGSKMVNGAV